MKKIINNLLKPLGYKFSRLDNYEDIKYQWLREFDIKTILDVGANEGQFILDIKKTLPEAQTFSFEPLKETFDILQTNIADNSTMKAFNVALGDFNGESKIFKNNYSPSSSLLELGEKHLQVYPDSDKVSVELIQVRRMDDFVKESGLQLRDNVLVKLDVQGFEDKVIKGGSKTLNAAKMVFVELSFWELYKEQPLFEDIFKLLTNVGFRFRGNYNVAYDKGNGLPIFSDGIFIRE